MAMHLFAVGQDVQFIPGRWDSHVPGGTYKITRALPGDATDRTYRARGAMDGVERVFREQQLRAGPVSPFG